MRSAMDQSSYMGRGGQPTATSTLLPIEGVWPNPREQTVPLLCFAKGNENHIPKSYSNPILLPIMYLTKKTERN